MSTDLLASIVNAAIGAFIAGIVALIIIVSIAGRK